MKRGVLVITAIGLCGLWGTPDGAEAHVRRSGLGTQKGRALRLDGVMQMVDRNLAKRRGSISYRVAMRTTSRTGRDRTLSPYFYLPEGAPKGVETLPLESTSAQVSIAGVIARVKVRQVYRNRGKKAIEAVYVFPGSTRAAVHGMRMKIGTRTIVARIKERQKARRIYNRAKRSGRRAALLSMERANVFTMRVANIMPGDRVQVELDYSELLEPEDGIYSFVYPTVVGPRYGGGANPKTSKWIANPYLRPGRKPTYKFGLKLHLQTPIGLKMVKSPSHKIKVQYENKQSANIKLVGSKSGNRDFVLRYRLAGGKIETGVMTYSQGGEQFFLMMMEPPRKVSPKHIPPREFIFVLDVSGSMYGFPLNTAKALIRKLMLSLRPTDYFNVVLFAGTSVVMSKRSLPASRSLLKRALRVVDRQRGGGGTELLAALRNAYGVTPPKKQGVSRSVVVITDGYVGVEAETFRFIRKNLGKANCYAFGIGSSVNRALIEGMSRAGMGAPFVVLNKRASAKVAERFRGYISSPVLTDIKLAFSSASVYDVVPKQPPDLLGQRPLIVFGKYRGKSAGKVLISGYSGSGVFKQTLALAPKASGATRPIRVLWARKWVGELMDQWAMLPGSKDIRTAVTNLGLTYNLLTRFTSFVAVDKRVVNRTGRVVGVKQPLPLPKGVSGRAVGGATAGRRNGAPRRAVATADAPAPPSPGSGGADAEEARHEKRSPLRAMPCSQRVGGCQCRTDGSGTVPLLLLPLVVWLLWPRRRRRE